MKTRSNDTSSSGLKRGRPSKFGRPSQVISLTLPNEVIRGLGKIHHDLGWAIVQLFERTRDRVESGRGKTPDFELVSIAERRALIAVNDDIINALPGVEIVPPLGDRSILAVAPEQGMAELELAVIDRLENPPHDPDELKTLLAFKNQLRAWRRDDTLRFHRRGIIVVERTDREKLVNASGAAGSETASRNRRGARVLPKPWADAAARTPVGRRRPRQRTLQVST